MRRVGADYFYVDLLNPRYGVWHSLRGLLEECFPDLTEDYERMLFNSRVRERYSERLVGRLSKLAKQAGLSDKMSLIF